MSDKTIQSLTTALEWCKNARQGNEAAVSCIRTALSMIAVSEEAPIEVLCQMIELAVAYNKEEWKSFDSRN